MKNKFKFIATLIIAIISIKAQAQSCSATTGIIVSGNWENKCGDGKNDYVAKFTNRTGFTVDIKHCLERKDGTWDCEVEFGVAHGKSAFHWVCKGTGRHVAQCRDVDSKDIFLTDKEISAKYR